MRKASLMFVLILTLFATACGKSDNGVAEQPGTASPSSSSAAAPTTEAESTPTEESEPSGQGIEVDKGLFSSEITLPATFFEGRTPEEVEADAKESGVSEVVANDDGSYTYKMSNKVYKKMLEDTKQSLVDYLDQLKKGEDFKSIKDVEYNKDLNEFTLIVDQSAFEGSFDSMATLGISITASMYQTFLGTDQADIKITIHFKDEKSGEVFRTTTIPE